MKTTAVFGGSFSPVHTGHMAVARGVVERGLADDVWLMPCRRNPLKAAVLMDDISRLRLLRQAADYTNRRLGGERIKVSELELEMPAPSYTSETLKALTEKYPDRGFRLVVGADSYLDFHRWRNWEWIVENFAPIVYPRPGQTIGTLEPGWTLLGGVEEVDISSTRLREMIKSNQPAVEYMPWITTGS